MNPAFVGPYLFEAVEENHMYKVPHMHTHEQIRARHRRIESDLEREEKLHEKYAPLQKYRSLSFRSTPKAPPVFRRGFRDFCPVSIPAHSSCSMRENASRNVSRLRTVSCTSGAPSTVTA